LVRARVAGTRAVGSPSFDEAAGIVRQRLLESFVGFARDGVIPAGGRRKAGALEATNLGLMHGEKTIGETLLIGLFEHRQAEDVTHPAHRDHGSDQGKIVEGLGVE
jgi:hypothetical protein